LGNLREKVERDLKTTLEGDWGLPIVFIEPVTGTKYDKSANDPEEDLKGQILYDTRIENPETGSEMIVHKPVVTVRRTSLSVVPSRGWGCMIPIRPDYDAPKATFIVERPSEEGGAIGFVRFYLMRAAEAPSP